VRRSLSIYDAIADINNGSACVVGAIDRVGVVMRSIPSVSAYIADVLLQIGNVTLCIRNALPYSLKRSQEDRKVGRSLRFSNHSIATQHKPRQNISSRQTTWRIQNFNRLILTVNFHLSVLRIDQPAKLYAIVKIFLQLRSQRL